MTAKLRNGRLVNDSRGRQLLLAAMAATSTESIAAATGVTGKAIRCLARGECAFPRLDVAVKLAAFLMIAPESWLRPPNEPPGSPEHAKVGS